MSEYNDGLHIPEGLSHESEIGSFKKNSEGEVGTMGKSQSEQVSTHHKSFKKIGALSMSSIPGLGRSPEGNATHFGILAWRIPWTGEPGRL